LNSAFENTLRWRWGIVFGDASHWPAVNSRREEVISQLSTTVSDDIGGVTIDFLRLLVALAPTPDQAKRASGVVLEHISDVSAHHPLRMRWVAEPLVALIQTPEQVRQAADLILDDLSDPLKGPAPESWDATYLLAALVDLVRTGGPERQGLVLDQLIARLDDQTLCRHSVINLATGFVRLSPTDGLAQRGADLILIKQLVDRLDDWMGHSYDLTRFAQTFSRLSPSSAVAENVVAQILAKVGKAVLHPHTLSSLVTAITEFGPSNELARQLGDRLFEELERTFEGIWIAELVRVWTDLEPSQEQVDSIADHIVAQLESAVPDPGEAAYLAEAMAALSPTNQQTQEAARMVMSVIEGLEVSGDDPFSDDVAGRLPNLLAKMTPARDLASRAAEIVTQWLGKRSEAVDLDLINALIAYEPTPAQVQLAASQIVDNIYTSDSPERRSALDALFQVGNQASRSAIIELLLERLDAEDEYLSRAVGSAEALIGLDMSDDQAERAGDLILDRLDRLDAVAFPIGLDSAYLQSEPTYPLIDEPRLISALDALSLTGEQAGRAALTLEGYVDRLLDQSEPVSRRIVEDLLPQILVVLAGLTAKPAGLLALILQEVIPTYTYVRFSIYRYDPMAEVFARLRRRLDLTDWLAAMKQPS